MRRQVDLSVSARAEPAPSSAVPVSAKRTRYRIFVIVTALLHGITGIVIMAVGYGMNKVHTRGGGVDGKRVQMSAEFAYFP